MNMGSNIGTVLGSRACREDRDEGEQATKTGALSLSIMEINDQITMVSRIIDRIEDLVFLPLPQECDNSKESPPQMKTVNGELCSINNRLISNKARLETILDGLGTQLDSNLRLT